VFFENGGSIKSARFSHDPQNVAAILALVLAAIIDYRLPPRMQAGKTPVGS